MVDLERRAITTASLRHQGQKHGDDPYIEHLLRVRKLLLQAGLDDPELIAAAVLHDVLEDTPYSEADLAQDFGRHVTEVVKACSRPAYLTRREGMPHMYGAIQRLAQTDGRGWHAAAVKLADRFDNVSACWGNKDKRLFMYHKEHPAFRQMIYPLLPAKLGRLSLDLDALIGR